MLLRLRHEGSVHGGGHSRVRALLLLLLLVEGAGLPHIEAHLRLLRRSSLLSLMLLLLRRRLLLLLLGSCGSGVLLLRRHAVRSALRVQLLRLLRLQKSSLRIYLAGPDAVVLGSDTTMRVAPISVELGSAQCVWGFQVVGRKLAMILAMIYAPARKPSTRPATRLRTGVPRQARHVTAQLTASRTPSAGSAAAAVAAVAAPAVVVAAVGEVAG